MVKRALRSDNTDAFDSIIFTLFDEASSVSTRRSRAQPGKVRMQRAKRFIELHACEKLQLEDIARELALTPFTVLRQFRAVTGKTPYAYLLQVRLEHAKHLLSRTALPVKSVGEKIGFSDSTQFSRFFRVRTGYSPSNYRSVAGPGA